MSMQDRDETRPAAPRRHFGGKWKGRGGRRLRNEGRRDEREQQRGSREDTRLAPRDLDGLLAAEAWSDEDEPEDTEEGDADGPE